MKKSMFYIDRAKQKQKEVLTSDTVLLCSILREIVVEWIEHNSEDANKSVGNCVLWRSHPLLFALLAEELAQLEKCDNKKIKFLMQAVNCYVLAKHLPLARICAERFSQLPEVTESLLRQAKNKSNQLASPLYCAVLFEIVAKMATGAGALCAYQLAGYFYAIAGEYQLGLVCIGSWMQHNVISYVSNVAIGFGLENPLFAAITFDLISQALLKAISYDPLLHYTVLENCKHAIYYYALANQVEILRSRVAFIQYIDYKQSLAICSLLSDKDKISKAPLMGAIICETYEQYREAARFYVRMNNDAEITRCAQQYVNSQPSLKSTDSQIAIQSAHDPYYRAVRKCLLERESEEKSLSLVSMSK